MGGPPAPTSSNGPPEGQTYCLRWNNHKSNLIEILDSLIKVESYVDCTIVVDDQVQFKAHRVVLAANSPYFQSILQDIPMDHCSIIFPGVKAFEMRALLEYMYTGEVNVTQSQIPKIMRIAEELEVKGLFDMADLKEKFNKLSEEHAERAASNLYASTSAPSNPYSSVTTTSSPSTHNSHPKISSKDTDNYRNNSSSVISTSSNVSPSAAPSSSSSPPYSNYKSPYSSLYTKSPNPSANQSASAQSQSSQQTPSNLTPTSERSAQWPMSPSAAAAAAMLSSVYESAPDMNPLKRKKLSSMSSMLMNRDTPILRNVLAQANPADSSQQLPLMLPNVAQGNKADKSLSSENNLSGHNNNHSYNGSDYGDKKYHDEPHSPFTDRSFEDDSFDSKVGNFSGNFGNNSNQKPEWKRYKQYTRSDIMSAIQCVREGMSALQASRKFGVPSRTLYDKVKKLGITTGRPMNRTMKRSPSSVESPAAFPYAHGYGQAAAAIHDASNREERELKEHHRSNDHHHLPPSIPHPAAALLDHAFLQQALENRGGGDIAGREALHAMALAAAAHAAANRMSTSPGPNGNAVRSPSPSNFALKYNNMRNAEQELIERQELERERERERERDFIEREREHDMERERNLERERDEEETDDHVEDLSVARKENNNSPLEARERPESPYSPEVTGNSDNEKSVIMTTKLPANTNDDAAFINETNLKREVVIDDVRAD
ncbi:BTB/POZ domain-containing protein ribbon isoform 1-T1 [Cochliomyia hominivorax]